tara:strand:+ start:433 stop:729 length:297 start_codon:yes stop_codon:yes gene_type:complete
MNPEKKNSTVEKWNILFIQFLHKYIYELKLYQDLILSNHLRIDYREADNLKNHDILPEWILKNMSETKLTPEKADYAEESYSRNHLKILIDKYNLDPY